MYKKEKKSFKKANKINETLTDINKLLLVV